MDRGSLFDVRLIDYFSYIFYWISILISQMLQNTSVATLSNTTRLRYALHAARGLASIHSRQRIHRDVKSGVPIAIEI